MCLIHISNQETLAAVIKKCSVFVSLIFGLASDGRLEKTTELEMSASLFCRGRSRVPISGRQRFFVDHTEGARDVEAPGAHSHLCLAWHGPAAVKKFPKGQGNTGIRALRCPLHTNTGSITKKQGNDDEISIPRWSLHWVLLICALWTSVLLGSTHAH